MSYGMYGPGSSLPQGTGPADWEPIFGNEKPASIDSVFQSSIGSKPRSAPKTVEIPKEVPAALREKLTKKIPKNPPKNPSGAQIPNNLSGIPQQLGSIFEQIDKVCLIKILVTVAVTMILVFVWQMFNQQKKQKKLILNMQKQLNRLRG